MPFSWKERENILLHAAQTPPEVLIIGGGVVGCSTAMAASRLGLNVLLLDKEDLASGASGNSTGLAHAGLRYLAQGRIGYVFQAGHERQHLQEMAPQWARPFHFILPVYSGEPYSLWKVHLGTWIYDLLSRIDAFFTKRPAAKRCRRLSAQEVQSKIPGLKSDGLQGAMEYFVDAQLQDARLTLGLAQTAAKHGAQILPYVEALEIQQRKEGGGVVICEDRRTKKVLTIEAKLIINATGAWIDALRHKAGLQRPTLSPSRGIHLVVDHITSTPLIFSTEIPGKVFFILPVDSQVSVVGTTDTPIQGTPDDSGPDPKEVKELIQRLFRVFPYLRQGANLQEWIANYKQVHVRHVYWGVRPLLRQTGSTLNASREHAIVKETAYLWSVPGVKLTSGVAVGDEIARDLWKAIRGAAVPRKTSDSLLGGELWDYEKFVSDAQKRFKLGEESNEIIRYLVSMYGTRYVEVLQWANREPHYRERILEGEPWILAQVPYAIQEEMVLTLNDMLWRRTKWALWRSLPDETVIGIAQEMAEILGWSPEVRQAEYQAYLKEKDRHVVH